MAAPPSEAGVVHDSLTWPLPAAAARLRGALSPPVSTVPDSETLTSSEGPLSPFAILTLPPLPSASVATARTWKAYVPPSVRRVTVLLVTALPVPGL